jgi:hypothetical protein
LLLPDEPPGTLMMQEKLKARTPTKEGPAWQEPTPRAIESPCCHLPLPAVRSPAGPRPPSLSLLVNKSPLLAGRNGATHGTRWLVLGSSLHRSRSIAVTQASGVSPSQHSSPLERADKHGKLASCLRPQMHSNRHVYTVPLQRNNRRDIGGRADLVESHPSALRVPSAQTGNRRRVPNRQGPALQRAT